MKFFQMNCVFERTVAVPPEDPKIVQPSLEGSTLREDAHLFTQPFVLPLPTRHPPATVDITLGVALYVPEFGAFAWLHGARLRTLEMTLMYYSLTALSAVTEVLRVHSVSSFIRRRPLKPRFFSRAVPEHRSIDAADSPSICAPAADECSTAGCCPTGGRSNHCHRTSHPRAGCRIARRHTRRVLRVVVGCGKCPGLQRLPPASDGLSRELIRSKLKLFHKDHLCFVKAAFLQFRSW